MNRHYIVVFAALLLASHRASSQTNIPPLSSTEAQSTNNPQVPLDQETKSALTELFRAMITSTNRTISGCIHEALEKKKILVITPQLFPLGQSCTTQEIKGIINDSWETNAVSVTYTSNTCQRKPTDVLAVQIDVKEIEQENGIKIMAGDGSLHYQTCNGAGFCFEIVYEKGKWNTRRLDLTYIE